MSLAAGASVSALRRMDATRRHRRWSGTDDDEPSRWHTPGKQSADARERQRRGPSSAISCFRQAARAAVRRGVPKIGGYGAHAAKLARCGVPFQLSSTIVRAKGGDHVEGAVIGRMDEHGKIIPGSETEIDCDTICIAVGLSPMNQLARMSGCRMEQNPKKAAAFPYAMSTSKPSVRGLFAAGDAEGIEEASSAMIEGRIAGIACANRLLDF